MELGLYIHIPYCLQKCHYCDFTTFSLDHELKMQDYCDLLVSEIRTRQQHIPNRKIKSIYFGGGTPSLLPAENILTLRDEIANNGFEIRPDAEITIEINPGTIDAQKLDLYLAAGVNRFSVGVQTFNDQFLKTIGREHLASTSRDTLFFLKQKNLNYSFDLLFGLPHQTLRDLEQDINEMISYRPNHVSLYNMTLPKEHFLSNNRAPEEEQAEMFNIIDQQLKSTGIERYELSNFATPGWESLHNQIYWSDEPYWGIGISAHSYLPEIGKWGTRFWNPKNIKLYTQQAHIENFLPFYTSILSTAQVENLELHQALTDYCHTHLRMKRGLSLLKLKNKFGSSVLALVEGRLATLTSQNLLKETDGTYQMTPKGWPLANKVFLELTFLKKDLSPAH